MKKIMKEFHVIKIVIFIFELLLTFSGRNFTILLKKCKLF